MIDIKEAKTNFENIEISYATCHGLPRNIAIHNTAWIYSEKDLNARRKVPVDFHVALLRVIGYCIRSTEFHDTEHVNGTCVNPSYASPDSFPELVHSSGMFSATLHSQAFACEDSFPE